MSDTASSLSKKFDLEEFGFHLTAPVRWVKRTFIFDEPCAAFFDRWGRIVPGHAHYDSDGQYRGGFVANTAKVHPDAKLGAHVKIGPGIEVPAGVEIPAHNLVMHRDGDKEQQRFEAMGVIFPSSPEKEPNVSGPIRSAVHYWLADRRVAGWKIFPVLPG